MSWPIRCPLVIVIGVIDMNVFHELAIDYCEFYYPYLWIDWIIFKKE